MFPAKMCCCTETFWKYFSMHQISEIHIENFKSIKDASFTLTGYTPLVGYNNAGKTNILRAVQWAVRKTSLNETDFFSTSEPLIVTATITGVTTVVLDGVEEKHRNRIENYILSQTIKIKRSQIIPNDKFANIKLEILKDDGTWANNPTGIDAAIDALVPEPIFIGAMENSLDDLSKNTASSAIGNLIKEITEEVSNTYSQAVETALSTVEKNYHQIAVSEMRIWLKLTIKSKVRWMNSSQAYLPKSISLC